MLTLHSLPLNSKTWANMSRKTLLTGETQLSAALTVFSASSRLFRSTSGTLQLVRDWERWSPLHQPLGLGQMVQSLEQMLTTKAHSLSFGRRRARPRLGPSVALTWQPSLTWLQLHLATLVLSWGYSSAIGLPPGVVLCCVGNMSGLQARAPLSFVLWMKILHVIQSVWRLALINMNLKRLILM